MIQLHLSPTCREMQWPSDVFTIRGVKYEVHRCYFGDGPSAGARLAEKASGWRLMGKRDTYLALERINSRTKQFRGLRDLTPVLDNPYSRYYLARDVWRSLRPLTRRCDYCRRPYSQWVSNREGDKGYITWIVKYGAFEACSRRCVEILRKRLKRKKQRHLDIKSAQEHLRMVRRWLKKEREGSCQQ